MAPKGRPAFQIHIDQRTVKEGVAERHGPAGPDFFILREGPGWVDLDSLAPPVRAQGPGGEDRHRQIQHAIALLKEVSIFYFCC